MSVGAPTLTIFDRLLSAKRILCICVIVHALRRIMKLQITQVSS